MAKPVKIIQLSDTHLLADPDGTLLGVKTNQSLKEIIAQIQKKELPLDLIFVSGDLSQDGTEISYKRLAEELKIFNVPVYCVAGNHDDIKHMNQVYPYELMTRERQVVINNWQLIFLDSKKPDAVGGFLSQSQLLFLQNCLKAHPELYAAIIFHHEPVNIDSPWLDEIGLENAGELWKTIGTFPKVKAIFYGHIHQENQQVFNNIKCFSVPSTCIQFKPGQDFFTIEKIPPGYRWILLHDDGEIETGVERLIAYVGQFTENFSGY